MTLDQALIIALSALTAVVTMMWRILSVQHNRLEQKVSKQEEDITNLSTLKGAAMTCPVDSCHVRKLAELQQSKA